MHCTSLLLDVLALVGGTVHVTAEGAEPVVATILIEDGQIVAVGPELEVPDGAHLVDCAGLHLIPGMIDGLAYHDRQHDALYTNAGVTLVRDHGNELGRIFAERDLAIRDAMGGPALSISGAVLDGSPPSTASAVVLVDEHDAHRLVPTLLEEGVDFLAVGVGLGELPWRAVLELAHPEAGREVQVWGPVPDDVKFDVMLASPLDGVLFLDRFLPPGSWEDEALMDAAVERFAASGKAVVPLLRGNSRRLDKPGEDPIELTWLGPDYARQWRGELATRMENLNNAAYVEVGNAVVAAQRVLVAKLLEAGVPVVPGSGAPHPWLMPGHGLILELREWSRAGIAPADLVELATVRSARALGLADERGALAPGLVGDVVALRADPREDVMNLFAVELVVVRGKTFTRAELDRRLLELQEAQTLAHEAAALPIEVPAPDLPEGAVLLKGRVESELAGGRVAAERWAIVRELDGSHTFVGRRVTPGAPGRAEVSVHVLQRLRKQRLDGFEVIVTTAGHEIALRGMRVAGQWRIERRFDDQHVDTQAAREQLACVDAGSVTTPLLLAHSQQPGRFPVLRLDEALELEVVAWELRVDAGGGHVFKTPAGLTFAGFDELGAPAAIVDQRGNGAITTKGMEASGLGGPGLPVPAIAPLKPASAAPEVDESGD